jgi:hypothetical protein
LHIHVGDINLGNINRYVLDGKQEQGVTIERLTTIPMPHRGKQAVFRDRAVSTVGSDNPMPKSIYALMSHIDLLKWGLQYKRNVKKGWLLEILLLEKMVEDTKAAKNKKFWDDYQAQQIFIQGMQAALGDEFDPTISKQGRDETGNFAPNKNGVPQNFLTVKYLIHAYDISYTTFKRMKASSGVHVEKHVHKNKGKTVFEDKEFAAGFYFPYRMYLKQKWAEWMETDVGRNADPARKRVNHHVF